jgi:tRNA (guanine-N7-)-methyltransferase
VPKKKLQHFQENLSFPHLFQAKYHELITDHHLRTRWREEFFRNNNPVLLELGCGKGEYTIGLAEKSPEKNFIGMDIKGARLWRGCKIVQEKQLKNVAFLRSQVDHITKFFGKNEVSEIWITFPDPQLRKEKKRLTSPGFLEKYRNILAPGGIIHVKTDSQMLFNYTFGIVTRENLPVLFATEDLYHLKTIEDAGTIQTYYERKWLEKGKKICYLKFQVNPLP